MNNFWQTLPHGFKVLAPMYGATDTVFRQIVASIGKPDVMMTEFCCVDQLYSHGVKAIAQLLEYTENERPIVAQIWGTTPELFYNAAQMMVGLGFDGIDINMGCPEKSVIKVGAGAALIEQPELASQIIQATKAGTGGKIPVSVKTRPGLNRMVTEQWGRFLLEQDLAALAIHGRTAKQQSNGPAHWEEIGKIVQIKRDLGVVTKIVGNGDVMSLEEAKAKVAEYGIDGVMMGRGVFANPLIFNPHKSFEQYSQAEKLKLLVRHVQLFEKTWGQDKNYAELKRFYKVYVQGFAGAAKVRAKLMETNSYQEVLKLLNP